MGNYELRITNYELRITNYELRITNYELRITNNGQTQYKLLSKCQVLKPRINIELTRATISNYHIN